MRRIRVSSLAELDLDEIWYEIARRSGSVETGAVRGLFARPETRHISIRLSAADLAIANRLAAAKGLPYQTYIKSLLHESLVRENSK
jgi:predicted DNA binding CopG/RHH family protein